MSIRQCNLNISKLRNIFLFSSFIYFYDIELRIDLNRFDLVIILTSEVSRMLLYA